MSLRFTPDAAEQVAIVLEDSALGFGAEAARRYALLIQVATGAIGNEPALAGSVPIRDAPG